MKFREITRFQEFYSDRSSHIFHKNSMKSPLNISINLKFREITRLQEIILHMEFIEFSPLSLDDGI